ncbi:MAG: hypothetical protein WCV90_07575 [Candidatus Woesearchaeota archaeon]
MTLDGERDLLSGWPPGDESYHLIDDLRQYTLACELSARGIRRDDFDRFYTYLIQEGALPRKEDFPKGSYQPIVRYLKRERVIGKDNLLDSTGLRVLGVRISLEKLDEFDPFAYSPGWT